MEIEVKRIAKKADYTIGKVYIDGKYFCDSIEDCDRGLTDVMTEAEIKSKKVYGKTAIPAGRYPVTITWSNHFKKNLPAVGNVKGYEGIRIHSGNTAEDTLGCIVLGQNKEKGKVLNSRATCNAFNDLLAKALKSGKAYITVS